MTPEVFEQLKEAARRKRDPAIQAEEADQHEWELVADLVYEDKHCAFSVDTDTARDVLLYMGDDMTPEGKIKKEIKEYLTKRGVWFFMPVSGGYGRRGIPDIVACYKGWFLGIEVKVPGGTPDPWQKRELASIHEADGMALVAYDVSDVVRALDCVDRLGGDYGANSGS